MKRCKYCNGKLKPKSGDYIAKTHISYSHDGGGLFFKYWHIECREIADKIEDDINIKKALQIICKKRL